MSIQSSSVPTPLPETGYQPGISGGSGKAAQQELDNMPPEIKLLLGKAQELQSKDPTTLSNQQKAELSEALVQLQSWSEANEVGGKKTRLETTTDDIETSEKNSEAAGKKSSVFGTLFKNVGPSDLQVGSPRLPSPDEHKFFNLGAASGALNEGEAVLQLTGEGKANLWFNQEGSLLAFRLSGSELAKIMRDIQLSMGSNRAEMIKMEGTVIIDAAKATKDIYDAQADAAKAEMIQHAIGFTTAVVSVTMTVGAMGTGFTNGYHKGIPASGIGKEGVAATPAVPAGWGAGFTSAGSAGAAVGPLSGAVTAIGNSAGGMIGAGLKMDALQEEAKAQKEKVLLDAGVTCLQNASKSYAEAMEKYIADNKELYDLLRQMNAANSQAFNIK